MRTQSIVCLLLIFLTACAPVSVAPTPSPTATIRPTPSQTPTPRPIGLDKIGSLGGEMVYSVIWSPDGKTYIIAKKSGLHIFDTTNKQEIKIIPSDANPILYSPDSQFIIAYSFTSSVEDESRLIRLSDGKVLLKSKYRASFSDPTFSPDSHLFAYITRCDLNDGENCRETVHIWDITARQEIFTITTEKDNTDFFFSEIVFDPTSTLLLTSEEDGTIRVWDIASNKLAFRLTNAGNAVHYLVFSHNRQLLASYEKINWDFKIALWDWKTRQRLPAATRSWPEDEYADNMKNLSFSEDDTLLNFTFRDNSTMAYNLATKKSTKGENLVDREALFLKDMRSHGDYIDDVHSMAYSPNGQTLAVSDYSVAPIIVWDLRTQKVRATLDQTGDLLRYTHDGKRLIVLKQFGEGGNEHTDITIWDTEQYIKLHTITVHDQLVIFEISRDDATLAIPTVNAIALWDIEKGTLLKNLPTIGEWPSRISYSADGRTLSAIVLKEAGKIAGGVSVQTWDVATGKQLPASLPPVHFDDEYDSFDLHHDIFVFYPSERDPQTEFWDIKSGKKIWAIEDQGYDAPRVSFTPNDQIILIHRHDGSSLYNIYTDKTIYDFGDLDNPYTFSPDGKQFANFEWRKGSIMLWDSSQIVQSVP